MQIWQLCIAGVLLIAFFVALLVVFIGGFFQTPFVPSRKKVIKEMLRLAKIKKGERVVDLGCGDGRILIRAEKDFQAKAEGYEISRLVWLVAQLNRLLHRSNVKIYRKNFFQADLRKADVVFCYLLPGVMQQLSPKFRKELKRDCRVVSASFKLPGWKTIQTSKAAKHRGKVFLYKKS
jgi:predicted TPR repeat methyltransferase